MKLTMMTVTRDRVIMFQGVAFARHEVLIQASDWINSRTDINSEYTTEETIEKFFPNWDYVFAIKEVELAGCQLSGCQTPRKETGVVERNVVAEAKVIAEHSFNAEVNARKDFIMNALGAVNDLDALRKLSVPKLGHSSNELEQIVRDTCYRLFNQLEAANKEKEYFNSAMDALVAEGLIVTAGLRLTPINCKVGPKEHVWIKVVPTEMDIQRYCSDNFATVQSSWELKEIYPCFTKPKNVTIILSPRDIERGWKIVWRH